MIKEKLKICLNLFERVGTDWKAVGLSNKVGTAVLSKKQEWSEFGGISRLVCLVGTVGTETSVLEKLKEVSDGRI